MPPVDNLAGTLWIVATPIGTRDAGRIDVVIHPQSVIHSMVEFTDGSLKAQLGNPDMRTPIAHALGWPEFAGKLSGVIPEVRYQGLAHTVFVAFGSNFSSASALVEKTTWTGAAVLLAADLLYGLTPAGRIFSHDFWKPAPMPVRSHARRCSPRCAG